MSGTADAGFPKEQRGGTLRIAVLVLGVLLLGLGIVLMMTGPTLYRMGLVDLQGARVGVQDAAMWVLVGAVALGALGLLLAVLTKKHRIGIVAVLLMIGGGMPAGQLYSQSVSLAALPPINDVQTDWSLPVAFTETALKERKAAEAIRIRDDATVPEGNGKWTGMTYAVAQAEVYKDIVPLRVKGSVARAVEAAAKSAERLGWKVTVKDPQAGVVEAVALSRWYDLASDVSVRVLREPEGARIDVRAASRKEGHDLGENAALVKQLIDEMALMLR